MKTWFKNLKVKSKLAYTFTAVIIFLIVIGSIGLYSMSFIQNSSEQISSVRMPAIDYLLQIDRDMQQALVSQRTMIFTNVASPKFQELLDDYNENVAQAKERWGKFRDLGEIGFDPQMLSGYESAVEEWLKFSSRIITARQDDTPEGRSEAIDLSFREGSKTFEAARDYIDQLTQKCEELAAAEVAESAASFSSAFLMLSIGIGIILLFSVFSALVISKTLGDPLVTASQMMNELKLGHLNSRINYKSKDEIGILTGSMDAFADTLQEFTTAMHNIAEGELNTEVKLLDKDDQLSPALNKIVGTLKELKNETDILITNSLSGNLGKRGNAAKFKGGYREIVKGFNDTLDAVILPINEGSKVLQTMATGDLTVRVNGEYKGDHQIIKNSINELGDSLTGLLSEVIEAVQATASASNEISSSAEEMAAGSQEQSAQTTEVAGAVEQMTATILETSKNSSVASENAKYSMKIANEGGEVVAATVEGMKRISEVVSEAAGTVKELGKNSDQIGEIIQVIDDIADQTNLLALNAAIEAARAGEQGRGFAVVADEVRKLAERTTKATKEIAAMIKQIQKDTGDAVQSMESGTEEVQKGKDLAIKAGDALKEIIKGAMQTVDIVNQVAAASEEQSSAAEQISKNIEGISAVTHEAASGVAQIARAAEDLSQLTTNLQGLVNRFRIDNKALTYKGKAHHNLIKN